jgi:hypothetical protein
MSTQERGKGIRTNDIRFMRHSLQPIELSLGDVINIINPFVLNQALVSQPIFLYKYLVLNITQSVINP